MPDKSILLLMMLALAPVSVNAGFDSTRLDNLFMSQSERKQIEQRRQGYQPVVKQVRKKTESVTINGFVKRSDGPNTVWVNGNSTLKNTTFDNVKVGTKSIGSANQVRVNVDGKRLKLKPGESWQPPIDQDSKSNTP